MAQSYTRQSTFADGDTITASLFNNEYNQLLNAFAYSSSSSATTGHRHDGSTGQGGNVPQIGDLDFNNKIVVDSTNNRWGVYVEVSGSAVEQVRIQDGAIVPVTDNDIDLGTSSLEFKDLFLDGTAHVDTLDVDVNATVAGTLGVTGVTTLSSDLSVGGNLTVTGNATIAGNLTFGDAASDTVAFSADVASNLLPSADNTYDLGASGSEWKDLYIDGTANLDVVDIDGTVDMASTLTVAGAVDFNSDLDVDGVTNLDVVDIDGAVDMATTLTVAGAVDFNSDLDVDGITNLDVVDIDGAVDMATTLTVAGNVDLNADLDVDGVASIDSLVADTADINGGTIDGATIATSDITVGSGKTLNVSAGTLTLADNQISGDKVEGGTIAATTITTLTSTTGNITSVNATTVDTTNLEVTTLKAKDGTAAGSIADSTGVVTVASSVLTTTDINGGTIDGVTIGGSSAGNITYANLSDGTITITAFVDEDDMSSDSATLVPTQQSVKAYVDAQVTAQDFDFQGDSGGALSIDLDSETMTFTGGTGIDTSGSGNAVTFAIDSTVTTLTGSQTLTNKVLTSPDINTPDIDGGTIDGTVIGGSSAAAITGTVITGSSLDISGDADIDGTLEADAITVNGTALDEVIADTVGAMVSSNTETNIAVTYDDSDNTLDFVIGTLNQDTTGNAATATALETARTIGGVSFDGTANITPTTFTTATFSGDVNVDSGVLFVDVSENKVGINQTSPDVSLDLGSNTDAVHVPVGTTAQRPGSAAAGYFRYNTSLAQFEGYTDAWGAIGGGGTNTFTHDVFTCNGSTTAFTLSQSTESENNLIVFVDGVFQEQSAYSIATSSGVTTLTMSAAPANGRKLVVYTVAAGVSGSNLNIDTMTGDGSDTTLTLSINPVNENNTQVFIDGVYQSKANYSISGTTLTFSTAPPTGSSVEVMTMTQTDINVPVDGTITSAKLSGDLTLPGSLTFADNEKAIFGAGSDLQIYHDASHSYVVDAGTGNMYISTNGNGIVMQASLSETMLAALPNGAVTLYHDNSAKLATTASGIDVTGTVTADGLTVAGDATISDTTPSLLLMESDTTDVNTRFLNNGGDFFLSTINDAKSSVTNRFSLDHATGDISFYEDTGTTAKLFWDASAESLGIGGTPATARLEVTGAFAYASGASSLATTVSKAAARIRGSSDATASLFFGSLANDAEQYIQSSNGAGSAADDLVLNPYGGTVLVGTPTVAYAGTQLNIGDTSDAESGVQIQSATGGVGYLLFGDGASAAAYRGQINYVHATDHMAFHTAGGEAMRITSAGDVYISQTNGSSTTVGHILQENGKAYHIADGNNPLHLTRLNSDGDIQQFYKGSTHVGSIGVTSGSLGIGQSSTGLGFFNTDSIVFPATAAGSARDAAIDLGYASGGRFKDLYLSAAVRWYSGTTQKAYIMYDGTDVVHYGASGVGHQFWSGGNRSVNINSSGNLLVHCSATPSATQAGFLFTTDQLYTSAGNTTSSNTQVRFINGNGLVGSISTAGSGTAYATSSDYRLKENVVAMSGATERLKQLKPSRFNFIADADTTVDGFLAHEVQGIVPEAVTGTKDAVDDDGNPEYQGIDQSKLVPLLVATIQELEARIAALES